MFEIGKEVVCIKSHSTGAVKKGQNYIVTGVGGCGCGTVDITVGIKNFHNMSFERCRFCTTVHSNTGEWQFDSSRFIPVDEIAEIEVIKETIKKPEVVTP